ncbi:hypothetical protein ACWN8P_00775 [Vagococcus salmoninarum]|uniref:Gram-positive cocci surface proteins LPxTG domain-containing protein n=1 Tax=Vagococcus salmoninarum TaxID=2739 RepID=A0A429ZVQ3_9ENTE|nr:hypothetical protein [Vagococcus salmoninarum]RST97857.1 hypothetical protein CBF35_00765 [Vagococcus salmoninarum]
MTSVKLCYSLLLISAYLFLFAEPVAAATKVNISENNQKITLKVNPDFSEITNGYPGMKLATQSIQIKNELNKPIVVKLAIEKTDPSWEQMTELSFRAEKHSTEEQGETLQVTLEAETEKEVYFDLSLSGKELENDSQGKVTSISLLISSWEKKLTINEDEKTLPQTNNSSTLLGEWTLLLIFVSMLLFRLNKQTD